MGEGPTGNQELPPVASCGGVSQEHPMRRRWYSFEGLTPGQKKTKARRGVLLALVLFLLMNVLAFG